MAHSMLPHENVDVTATFGSASLSLFGGVCTEVANDVWTIWTVVRNSVTEAATEIADELSAISPFRIRD